MVESIRKVRKDYEQLDKPRAKSVVGSLKPLRGQPLAGAAAAKQDEGHSRYLAQIQGPLLFTAPHSGKLYRGGPDYEEKKRIHLREKYTAALALRFALDTEKQLGKFTKQEAPMGGFCVWATDHKLNDTDTDPNYLLKGKEHESPFHRVLHAWTSQNFGNPLMHIDIHGKMDRKDNYELDLGVSCMWKHWLFGDQSEDLFVQAFVERLTQGFNRVLLGIPKYKEYKAICNNDPYLNGNWGSTLRTMTEQAAELGIPTLQLEIPLKMRTQLFSDLAFSKAFLNVILETYAEVVVPWWPTRTLPMLTDPEKGRDLKLMQGSGFKKEVEARYNAYMEWERKQSGTTEKVI